LAHVTENIAMLQKMGDKLQRQIIPPPEWEEEKKFLVARLNAFKLRTRILANIHTLPMVVNYVYADDPVIMELLSMVEDRVGVSAFKGSPFNTFTITEAFSGEISGESRMCLIFTSVKIPYAEHARADAAE